VPTAAQLTEILITGARQTINPTSDFGTFGVAGDRPVSGRACALFVNAYSATLTVIVFPAADFPYVH